MRSAIPWVLLWTVGAQGGAAAPAPATRHALVLYSNGRLLPANVELERGLRSALSGRSEPVELWDEFLDEPRFTGPVYADTMFRYLSDKYASAPPEVVVAAGSEAARFLLIHRDRLFPNAPVVHVALDAGQIRALGPLPAHFVGIALQTDFVRTIEQALRWQPGARRLAIVTGTSERDRQIEALMRVEVGRLGGRVTPEFLAAWPMPAILDRLRGLDDDWIVFTPGLFADGAGRRFIPRDSVVAIAAAAAAPVYGSASTFLGTGIVGGYSTSFEAVGREAGQIMNSLLDGASPSSLRLPDTHANVFVADWRQLRRWRFDEGALPADAIVQFRPPGLFKTYRNEAIAAGAVLLLQTGLIALLLVERRRRRRAEQKVHVSRAELAHASRLAVAGELTAALAHEINQPLGAILSNADAAEMILDSGTERRDLLRQIVGDIRRDDLRASAVIDRLRALLRKQEVDRRPFELRQALADVTLVVGPEAARRRVTLHVQHVPEITLVADRVQVLQMLINLVVNALDAVADAPEPRRLVVVSAEAAADRVRITVRDYGRGITVEPIDRVFESFYSTKPAGMGIGLSITRTLVEAHGGRVWAENDPAGGARFHIELPLTGHDPLAAA